MNRFIFLSLAILIVSSCKKEDITIKQTAKVEMTRYACGPACDAFTFAINPNRENNYYLPQNLPAAFRKDGLVIKISYTKTGLYPGPYEGPQFEKINIVTITSE